MSVVLFLMNGNVLALKPSIVFNHFRFYLSHMEKSGIAYLVGAGPGDPGLMTVKGKEVIQKADVLIYDALAASDFLNWVKPDCELIYAGKRAGFHSIPQDAINQLIVDYANSGKMVVRLKGGDPYVFGRGGEEAYALHQAGIPFEVVPGITSAIAGPSYAGIPVTDRRHSTQFTVFTGHEDPTKETSSLDFEAIAHADGTKIMLMGMERLDHILTELIEHGQDKSTPAAAIQWATTGKQRTVVSTVGKLAKAVTKAGLSAPAIVVIGSVIEERDTLNWFEKLPLFGKKIVVTRTRAQASELSSKLRALGAEVSELPTIRIADPQDKHAFAEAVIDSHTYDWLVFSSPNGVERFFKAFFAVYQDIRCIGGARIAAIGPGTAEKIRSYGLSVDLVPKKSVAEGLVQAFKTSRDEIGGIEHQTFLWVHAEGARDVIAKGLSAMQAIVDECVAYRTEPETDDISGAREQLEQEGADLITFTSSSTVENFFNLELQLPESCKVASIGPVTSSTLAKHDIKPDIVAKTHDIDGLVEAIVKRIGKKS
jgi:uroporphyrinogen III methyltransferase/synthase